MSKRVIILGANGFIGSGLLKRFKEERDSEVLGFSSQDCNLLSLDSVKKALSNVSGQDVLVLAAAITRSRENTAESMMKNIQMVENTIKVVAQQRIAQAVFFSSVDVYGCLERKFPKNVLITEKFALKPDDYYGTGKVACEVLLQNELRDKGVDVLILRLPGVFGPGDGAQSLIGRFTQSIAQKGVVTVYGTGEDRRDYIYIDDVFQIVKSAIANRLNATVNLVSGQNYSIREIVDMISKAMDTPCRIEAKEVLDTENERIKNMRFDPAFLRQCLPDFEIHDLSWGIKRYLKSFVSTL